MKWVTLFHSVKRNMCCLSCHVCLVTFHWNVTLSPLYWPVHLEWIYPLPFPFCLVHRLSLWLDSASVNGSRHCLQQASFKYSEVGVKVNLGVEMTKKSLPRKSVSVLAEYCFQSSHKSPKTSFQLSAVGGIEYFFCTQTSTKEDFFFFLAFVKHSRSCSLFFSLDFQSTNKTV